MRIYYLNTWSCIAFCLPVVSSFVGRIPWIKTPWMLLRFALGERIHSTLCLIKQKLLHDLQCFTTATGDVFRPGRLLMWSNDQEVLIFHNNFKALNCNKPLFPRRLVVGYLTAFYSDFQTKCKQTKAFPWQQQGYPWTVGSKQDTGSSIILPQHQWYCVRKNFSCTVRSLLTLDKTMEVI